MEGFTLENGRAIHEWLSGRAPSSVPQLTEFPSGAWIIDIDVRSVQYAIEFSKRLGVVGVSKVADAVYGFEGFDQSFGTAEDLKKHLDTLFDA